MIPFSYSLRSIARRRVTAVATASGLALVVFVISAVLMVASGVEETLRSTGSPEHAIVLRKGSTSELTSLLSREAARTLLTDPAIAVRDGKPVASAELAVIQQLERAGAGGPATVAFRGLTALGLQQLRGASIQLQAGRLFRPGTSEVVLGRAVRGRYRGAELGQVIRKARREWTVVGVFEAQGSAFESEIWGDADVLGQALNRNGYSSLTVRLAAPSALPRFAASVDADRRYELEARREDLYYAESSSQLATFIRVLGFILGVFFAVGATLGAMITMYTQVMTRVREIGTLRALGFHRRAVLLAFVVESTLLALAGGAGGLLCASLLGGTSFTTLNFASFTEVCFRLRFAPLIGLQAMLFALVMGLAGGLLPALRAARMPIVHATRAS